MKRFFKYIIWRIAVLILVLILLDILFTSIYSKKKGIRNKIEYVFQNSKKNYDYIFLGSSRVEYHIDTELIDADNNTRSLNMGVSGQDLTETFLLLKLLIYKSFKAKKYFIQLDESDFSLVKEKSFIGASYFMPYVDNNEVKNHLEKYDDDFILDTKAPFYRYMNYGYKIGYRELLLKLNNKNRRESFYIGLKPVLKDNNASYLFKEKYNNDLLNEIKSFAKEENVALVFFTSPYYNPQKTVKFKKFAKQNNINQYIDSIKKVEYFKDSDHLNYLGARIFTEMLIRDFNLKY